MAAADPPRATPGQPAFNRVALWALRHRLARGLTALRYTTSSEPHRVVVLPAGRNPSGDGMLVVVGQASRKRWWRRFREPAPAAFWAGDGWVDGTGRLLTGDARAAALADLATAHPSLARATDLELVRIDPLP